MTMRTLLQQRFYAYRLRGSLAFLLLGTLLCFSQAVAWAGILPPVPTSSAVQEVRSLYPSEWGVEYVDGIAYASELDHIFLLSKAPATAGTTKLVTITPLEDWVSTITVTFPVDNAVNLTFDNRGRRLLLLNNGRDELAQITLDANNLLNAESLALTTIAAWNTRNIQGMVVDNSGENLYLLDTGARQIIQVGLTGNDFSTAPITRIDIAELGSGLRGLTVHPSTGNLYVGNPANQRLYEVTSSGQLLQAHSLWSLELNGFGGFVFARSADRTDPAGVYHLLVSSSNLQQLTAATVNDTPNAPDHAIYLPVINNRDSNIDAAATAMLYGEVVEVALCKPSCGSNTWSFIRQVSSGADDAEERGTNGDMSELNSSDLELIREAKTDQIVGVRFQNVTIPKGAIIQYAAIEFEADETEVIPTDLIVYGEAASNATPFAMTSYNISRRLLTTANVKWQGLIPWYWADAKYHTPNLAPIVQELVQRENWKNGNALAFIIKGSGRRTAESYDGEPAAAPKLYVEYTLQATTVPATVETAPVPNSGDAADDPAIWVHPTDPALSTIIGTDKLGGLAVYDLNGQQLQYISGRKINNVDLRYRFPLSGSPITLVAASSPSDDSIALFRVNPATRLLENVAARPLPSALPVEAGVCMYHSPTTDKFYVILNDLTKGDVEQWELFDNGAGAVDAKLIRAFTVGYQTEGCVADDELGTLYIASEDVGIWKYGAEPEAGINRQLIDAVGAGRLTADVEGLTIYYTSNGGGYLIASSQGSNQFVVYQRGGTNNYVMTFGIEASPLVDKVAHTDGIDVINAPLGPAFPFGLFVAQDDYNEGANQNFKLVSWESIAYANGVPLIIDTTWKP